MTEDRNIFPKSEHLCGVSAIDNLFSKGKRIHVFPFSVVFLKRDDELPSRILISVAKKRFHNAVDRNRVKRLIRAAYRQNKFPSGYDVALIYVSDKIESYEVIEQAIIKINNV
ncbi:MAG: ribonuclease P protein component [Paludibacteraceae bacterium]|nr:ribonuclease P protein component [Paludibacteraceae bacterium]